MLYKFLHLNYSGVIQKIYIESILKLKEKKIGAEK